MQNKGWRAEVISPPKESDIGFITKLENRRIAAHWIAESNYWVVSTKALTETREIYRTSTILSDEGMDALVGMVMKIKLKRAL